MTPSLLVSPKSLTVRNKRCDEAGGSGHDVGRGKREASAYPLNGEEDEEGSGELHQARNEEVYVDISSQNSQPHDQTLVDDCTGEPGAERFKKPEMFVCWD